MNYYNLCFIILILLMLAIILFIYNKYNTNIETLENKKCDSLNIELNSNLQCPTDMSSINMSNNNIIDFNQPPGIHGELNKLFIWRKLANCCIVDFTYHNNYIYGVGTNGHIYRILKSGGNWIEYIKTGSMTNIVLTNINIYGINKSGTTYRRAINGTGDWQEFGQKGWKTTQLFTDNHYLYGIGLDHKINYIPLSGGEWKNYSPGDIVYAMIFKNNIYGIGTDYSVYRYPLIPPPIQNNPICSIRNTNNQWTRCAYENEICKFEGIADVMYKRADGRDPNNNIVKRVSSSTPCNNATFTDPTPNYRKACYYKNIPIIDVKCNNEVINTLPSNFNNIQSNLSSCRDETENGHFGKCPVIHNHKWEKLSECCVTNIQAFGNNLYGRDNNGKIFKVSLQNGGKWQPFINNGWVSKILIIDNNIYGIGKDNALYIHPIKEDTIEEFTNYISTNYISGSNLLYPTLSS